MSGGRRKLVAVTAAASVMVVAVVAFAAWTVIEIDRQATHNRRALCLLKDGYAGRIHREVRFLRDHPGSDLRVFFTAALMNNRESLKSLSDLNCGRG